MTTTIHTKNWPSAMAEALKTSESKITLTALSCLPPAQHKPDAFGLLYSAIIAAAERIKEVIIILPMPSKMHPATAQNATAAATLRAIGCTVWLHPAANLLHAKTCCIDHAEAWIGSGNFTSAAAHHNNEAWMQTDDPRAIADLQAFHLRLVKNAINSERMPA
jgi:phosphatidylserine/phosphatidylglycerophosphate/cardiolipin synthase-like enzyme